VEERGGKKGRKNKFVLTSYEIRKGGRPTSKGSPGVEGDKKETNKTRKKNPTSQVVREGKDQDEANSGEVRLDSNAPTIRKNKSVRPDFHRKEGKLSVSGRGRRIRLRTHERGSGETALTANPDGLCKG